ncbi:MAG: hypothetical protein K6F34_01295 [Lachnospiraceae bacterium]|nr:hypothetical protein [Lachnospiraceae bacterium]
MDYNNDTSRINQGMQRPGTNGPMNPGMPPQGMPMQGMPGGMQRPGTNGPMNPGMPPQGMPGGMQRPGTNGPVNPGMPPQGMPMQGPAGRNPRSVGMNTDDISARLAKGIEGRINSNNNEPDRKERHGLSIEKDLTADRSAGFKQFGEGMMQKFASFRIPSGVIEGISGASHLIFGAILVLCLIIALIAFGKGHGSSRRSYNIPTDMTTYSGIFLNAYNKAVAGSLTGAGTPAPETLYDEDGTEVPPAPTAIGEDPFNSDTGSDTSDTGSDAQDDSSYPVSDSEVTGAAMVLDSGTSGPRSHKDLLSELDSAIGSGDIKSVGGKMAYEDENGNLKGYPESVVSHFISYMSANSDKKSALMAELSDEKYSAQHDEAYVVKLPLIKFVVNMGYDNTTVSISGFSDQVVNAGQSADIAPLLPCMYTLTISNPEWPEATTRDIEANVSEPAISINIKP